MIMNELFAKFNELVDIEGLKKDVEAASANSGDFVEVPFGDYEVKVSRIELGATGEKSKTPGAPMLKVWFTILSGEFKNQKIFYNQLLTTGFGVHKANEFLNSLESGVSVLFENFEQYNEVITAVFNAVDSVGEYQLHYGQNAKGFNEYVIVQRFTN